MGRLAGHSLNGATKRAQRVLIGEIDAHHDGDTEGDAEQTEKSFQRFAKQMAEVEKVKETKHGHNIESKSIKPKQHATSEAPSLMQYAHNQHFVAEDAKNNTVGIYQHVPVNKFGMKIFTNFWKPFRKMPK
jgi:hypothetical protein